MTGDYVVDTFLFGCLVWLVLFVAVGTIFFWLAYWKREKDQDIQKKRLEALDVLNDAAWTLRRYAHLLPNKKSRRMRASAIIRKYLERC